LNKLDLANVVRLSGINSVYPWLTVQIADIEPETYREVSQDRYRKSKRYWQITASTGYLSFNFHLKLSALFDIDESCFPNSIPWLPDKA
jgi:hypothetical protein